MSDELSFGRWLQRRRKALDLTQEELAQRVGCAAETLRKIEADARRPSRQIAERLAEALELPTAEYALFVKAARAELAVDRLVPPSQSVPQVAFVPPSALPSGTVTFVFTDIEGSTQLWEHHPQAMRVALARHDAILRHGIAAHGGVIFKTAGDGVNAAFARAPDALAAALVIQRTLDTEAWGATGPLRVRMALHTDMAEERDGDYFGPPLNRVARLLAVGHGQQMLLSLGTAELVHDYLPPDVELRDLGTHRLKDLTRPEQIFQVIAPDLPTEFPPLTTLDAHSNNLPVQPTPLIDRDAEVAQMCELLRHPDARLVTVTGPGGVGKTRLALQVAAELLDAFPHGIYVIPLAPLSDPALVAMTIAQTLGIGETGNRPLMECLANYLRDKQLLLLLDNFEQVVTAAVFVSELLAAAPRVHILVTSREVLRLQGEKGFELSPLALPDLKRVLPIESLSQYAAVQLFIQRALDAKPDFAVTNANAPAVAEICHRLDGLPLAIELAAAWVKLFSPEALLTRLARPLRMLTRGARDMPARQQTMRDTIAWSYNLLDAGEQALFRRLAVFVGGCTIEAAEATSNGTGDLPFATLDGLASLVDKNLLRYVEGVAGEPRFMMLETIREYALERLVEFGEAEALRRAHAAHYLALAEMAVSHLDGPQQQVWLARLEVDHDNLRAAILWQVERGNTEAALRFGAALWRFWWKHGYLSEGQNRLEAILALLEMGPATAAHNALRARVLLGAGRLANDQADYSAARSYCEQSQAIYQKLGDKRGVALALETLGQIATDQGDYVAAREILQRCLALSQEIGDQPCQATSLALLSEVAGLQGDYVAGRVLGEQSLALFQAIGDQHEIVRSLDSLGWNAIYRGDYRQATPFFEQSLRLGRELGQKEDISSALNGLGDVAWYQGDYTRAAVLYKEGLALRQELGDKRGCAVGLTSLGETALAQGDIEQAARLYRESLELNRRIQYMPGIVYCLFGFASISAMRGLPERAARLAGAAAALCDAIGLGLPNFFVAAYDRSIAGARTFLGEEVLAAAWAAGQVLPLEQAIAEALNVTAPGPAHSHPSTIVS